MVVTRNCTADGKSKNPLGAGIEGTVERVNDRGRVFIRFPSMTGRIGGIKLKTGQWLWPRSLDNLAHVGETTSVQKSYTERIEEIPWTCGKCTYINQPSRTKCEMCGGDKPTQVFPPGETEEAKEGNRLHTSTEEGQKEIVRRTMEETRKAQEEAYRREIESSGQPTMIAAFQVYTRDNNYQAKLSDLEEICACVGRISGEEGIWELAKLFFKRYAPERVSQPQWGLFASQYAKMRSFTLQSNLPVPFSVEPEAVYWLSQLESKCGLTCINVLVQDNRFDHEALAGFATPYAMEDYEKWKSMGEEMPFETLLTSYADPVQGNYHLKVLLDALRSIPGVEVHVGADARSYIEKYGRTSVDRFMIFEKAHYRPMNKVKLVDGGDDDYVYVALDSLLTQPEIISKESFVECVDKAATSTSETYTLIILTGKLPSPDKSLQNTILPKLHCPIKYTTSRFVKTDDIEVSMTSDRDGSNSDEQEDQKFTDDHHIEDGIKEPSRHEKYLQFLAPTQLDFRWTPADPSNQFGDSKNQFIIRVNVRGLETTLAECMARASETFDRDFIGKKWLPTYKLAYDGKSVGRGVALSQLLDRGLLCTHQTIDIFTGSVSKGI